MERLECEPPYMYPEYLATVLRAPGHQLVRLPAEWFHHLPGPVFGRVPLRPEDADLSRQHAGEPLGQRIIISGRVLDQIGRPVVNASVTATRTGGGAYTTTTDT